MSPKNVDNVKLLRISLQRILVRYEIKVALEHVLPFPPANHHTTIVPYSSITAHWGPIALTTLRSFVWDLFFFPVFPLFQIKGLL
jgi:hypothetical protein